MTTAPEHSSAGLADGLPDDETADRGRAHVQSLARGLAVIRAFGADRPEMSVSDVARATGLTRAAARRFLHTLVDLGYVGTDGRLFSLRPRVLELGYAYVSSLPLPSLALPHLERLTEQVGESSSVSVLDGDDIVYVARVAIHKIMTVAISVGTRFPAYATSMGRVLLADLEPARLADYLARVSPESLTPRTVTDPARLRAILEEVRAQGHALVDQELEAGLRSVAVPVRDRAGAVVAAMNVSAPVTRGDAAAIRAELLPALTAAAAVLSEDLARAGGPRPA
ncbi:MAG: IclR family transcriptional regulator C-terminal domain-containing protein [Kineosporiaceae bacterium]